MQCGIPSAARLTCIVQRCKAHHLLSSKSHDANAGVARHGTDTDSCVHQPGLLQASHLPSAGENKNAGDEPDEAAAAVFLATRSLLLSPPAPAPSPNGRGSGLTSSSSSHTITTIDTPAIDGTTTNTTTTTGVKERKDSLSTTTITDDKVSPSGPFDHQVHSEMPNTMQRGTAVRSPSPARLSTPQSVKSFRTVDSGYTAGSVDRTAYDALEAAVVEAQASPCPGTPVGQVLQKEAQQPQHVEQEPEQEQQQKPASQLTSPRRPQTPEDPIQALDALEDAVERVASLVPEVPASPEKKQQPQQQQESKQNQPWTKQASIPPRATKASQARISLAHGPKDAVPKYPSLGKPRTSLGGPNDVSSARNRVTSTASDRSTGSETSGAKKEVVIPHSKPRPMSMSFPAPPPPPKSRKPPTQSTFQLPGEAVAAKFKAAKEARLAQAAEAAKPKPFKARPVPASLGMGPAVRQTSSSLARECLITGKPVEQRSVSGPAEQRTASALGAHFRSTSSTTTSRTVSRAGLSSSHSAASSSSSTATTTLTAGASSQKSQGQAPPPKEVFSRASLFELAAAAEQEQKQKEEAVKRARAEAAERSRAISREWAERQRRKKAAAMASGGATPVPV